jgi:hypothetical protein
MIEYLPFVLTGLGLTVSIFYYARILENANKAKQRELINQRISTFTPEFYRNWRTIMSGEWSTLSDWLQVTTDNPDYTSIFNSIMITYNSIGVLLKNQILSQETIFSIYGSHFIIWTWERFQPVIEGNRELMNYDELFAGFEFLYNEAKREYPNISSLRDYLQKRQDLLNR